MQKAIKKYVEQLKKQLEKETDTSHIDYLKTTIEALSEQEETEKNISPKAKESIERLNDISYDIDKFIDLTMHGQIKNNVEDIEKEKMISATPPNIVGGALIIPKGLLHILTGKPLPDTFGQTGKQAIEYAAMKAVMDIESELGYLPKDVSALKCGYDIESKIPEEIAQNGFTLRMIEVKGRAKGATSVTVSKNEILTALNKPNEYILAIVEVDGEQTHTTYLKQPFKKSLDFAATSVNFNIKELIDGSEVLYGD